MGRGGRDVTALLLAACLAGHQAAESMGGDDANNTPRVTGHSPANETGNSATNAKPAIPPVAFLFGVEGEYFEGVAETLAVNYAAEQPQQPSYFARVDFVVINHVRTFHVTYDRWDRPCTTASITTWVSYYDWKWSTPLPGFHGVCVPVGWVNRGFVTIGNARMLRCTDGWLVETPEYTVITPVLLVVDSDYDFELRWRRIFRPIRRP